MLDQIDKIYCINLDDRQDRWEIVSKEFERVGIKNVHRFSAIKNNIGYIGCRDSHYAIIKDAKENNYNNILIFEDDVVFINDDLSLISNALKYLKDKPWDFIYLGANFETEHSLFKKETSNLLRINYGYAAHSYIINNKIFDYILEYGLSENIIDIFYNKKIISHQNSFVINPMMTSQYKSYSDIEKQMVDYSWLVDRFNLVKIKSNIV